MRFLHANDRPGVHAPSLYAETAGAPPERAPLRGEARAEVAVIGGGYAGLSAALHLAMRGVDVALLEAHRLGWGASGRNGGQLSYGPRIDIRAYERRLGAAAAARIWALSTEATRLVKRLIANHAIDCELRPGHLEAAWREADAREMAEYAEHVAARYGHPSIRPLDRDETRARIRSPAYVGGLEDGEGGHLHPLRLALGLARAAARAGVRLHERSEARAVEPRPDGVTLRTAEGTLRADRMLLACNGYLDGLDRRVAARVMPLNNFIVATEPLGDRNPLPGGECAADSKFVLNYFRPTPDGRLLFGGGETYSERFPADIRALVRRPLARVFPQLKDVALTHGWGGTLAITRSRAPLFMTLDARRLAIGGWSGAGVHMAIMGGRIAADALCGDGRDWAAMARAAAPPFPGGDRLRPLLLRAAMAWYALRDRA